MNDFMKLTSVLKQRKGAALEESTQDILALVGGILGIVAIAFAFVPYLDFMAVFLGIAAIVLGVLGLHSSRRHIWALLGIILGAIAIFIAIVFIAVHFGGFFIWI